MNINALSNTIYLLTIKKTKTMKVFTILRAKLLQIVLLWLCALSASAQVPSTMDYTIMATNPKTGQVLANKELLVKVELRLNSEDGETVWSKEETLTSSKSGICTMSLDFKDVDWTLGSYYIKVFIDGEPIGASQIKSVPFAVMADRISGVITKQELIGKWVFSRKADGVHKVYSLVFDSNGDFVYSYKRNECETINKGTWKVNNLGYISFLVTYDSDKHDNRTGKKLVSISLYDKEDKSLFLTGGLYDSESVR